MSKGVWKSADNVGLRAGQYKLVEKEEWLNNVGSLDVAGIMDVCSSAEPDRWLFHPNTAAHISGMSRRNLDRATSLALTTSALGYGYAQLPFGHVVDLRNESEDTVQRLILASSAQLSTAKQQHETKVRGEQQARGRARGIATQQARRNATDKSQGGS